jgi:hypothetical protein
MEAYIGPFEGPIRALCPLCVTYPSDTSTYKQERKGSTAGHM